MIDLRDYQQEALQESEAAEREGVRRPLVVHPTGTGKGVLMGGIAKHRASRGRSLVLIHRQELANQFIDKLGWQAPELKTGMVKAERNELDAPVVVASVPTIQSDARLAQLLASHKRSPFSTILADEAHHAPSPSWTKVLTAMGSFHPYGPLTIGFTATPERDGKTLGVWEKVVSYMSIREAIFRGFLCPILPAHVIETKMDLGKVRKTGGDYSGGDLGQQLEAAGAIEQMADAVVENARDRKGVAFLPTVRTSELLAAELVKRGIRAEHVDGATADDERAAILARLKTGKTQWVTNCAVLTEGFDEPSIDCVLIGRPTKFHGLYVQMVGRGTRVSPGKKNLLVLDVVGASTRHELVGLVHLGLDLDDPRKKKEGEAEKQSCPTCESPECAAPEGHRCQLCHRYLPAELVYKGDRRHDNCQARSSGQVDVFGTSRLRWLPIGPGWCLTTGSGVVVMAPVGTDTWKLASYDGGKVKILHNQIPGDWARGIGEDHAKAFQRLNERSAGWLNMPVSDLQKGRLVREGLPEKALPKLKTRGEAADLLTRITARRAMKKLGVPV